MIGEGETLKMQCGEVFLAGSGAVRSFVSSFLFKFFFSFFNPRCW